MNFSAFIEDGTYHYLSIIVIGLYILGTLQTSGGIIFVLMQRLFWDVLLPICLFLCHSLQVVSFWALNFLFHFFRWSQSLSPLLVRKLRYGPITVLGCWIQKAFTNLVVFYRKNINAQKPDPSGSQDQSSASATVSKVILGCLFYCLKQFWKMVWQGVLSMRYIKLSSSGCHLSSPKVDLKPQPSVLSKPQHATEPEISSADPTYPKRASPKFHLRQFPGQAYELNQET